MKTVGSGVFWAGVAAGVVLCLVLRHPAVQDRPAPHFTAWRWFG